MKTLWVTWFVLVVTSAVASAAPTRWQMATGHLPAELAQLDAARTATGYLVVLHERADPAAVQWTNRPCPGPSELPAGTVMLRLERQADGTFAVTVYKDRMYSTGADGLGGDPVTGCFFQVVHRPGRFVDRATAMAVAPQQVALYPADHDNFLLLGMGEACIVPEDAKHTCGGIWASPMLVDAPLVDTDGDGIYDEWEISGLRDGANRLDLKAMGANPDHKDVFIQIDSTEETGYPDQVLADVRSYFAHLPVTNPDRHNGITLHLDAGPETINVDHVWNTLSGANQSVSLRADGSFTTGTCTAPDRTPLTTLQGRLDPLRAKVFRYIVVAKHVIAGQPCSGMNWNIPSKAFVIGNWIDTGPAPDWAQKGVLLHELGHSLGLNHAGGTTQPNYKPNYQSVMNYAYQELGIPQTGAPDEPGRYIYSSVTPSSANAIKEPLLADDTGMPNVGLPGTLLAYTCSASGDAPRLVVAPRHAVDLRCDGNPHSAAPNDVTWADGNNPGELQTYNDVEHLHLPLEDGPSTLGAGRGFSPEDRSLARAMQAYGAQIGDAQPPTVKLSLAKKGAKRMLTINAHDDKGLAAAIVTSGTTKRVVYLGNGKKRTRDATRSIEVEATGDVSVVVNDLSDKSTSQTAK